MKTKPEPKPDFATQLAQFIKDHPASPLAELDRVMDEKLVKELSE